MYLSSFLLRDRDSPSWAGFYACSTAFTINISHQEVREKVLRFGIGAPKTIQRTTFQKNRRSDPGPVVDTESLDVKNEAFFSIIGVGRLHNKQVLSDLPDRKWGEGSRIQGFKRFNRTLAPLNPVLFGLP